MTSNDHLLRDTLAELRIVLGELDKVVSAVAAKGTPPVPALLPLGGGGDPVRQLHGAAATLALAVLADSAIEHYRGSFENKAMFLALVSAGCNVAAGTLGTLSRDGDSHAGRAIAYAAAVAVGATGTGFHVYNVGKRVGGFRWENLFYGAPLGAPAALSLSGLVGLAGEHVGKGASGRTLFGLPAGRVIALGTSLGLLGTVGEAGLLHFRGNFQNPAMYLPVALPPVAAAVLVEAALRPGSRKQRLARGWLGLTSFLGVAGMAFHAYGVSRHMGGWRNWRQNLLDGPPIPAPPSFSGLALAGIAALTLIERENR